MQDTYGNYAELRHTAYDFIKEGHPKADDIDVQREYMDTVCRNFASRLERRRNMVICSTRFHRFAEDVSLVILDKVGLGPDRWIGSKTYVEICTEMY